ncbi:DUF3408 domain-containing protein [Chryseobacterium defluvii]|uniref:Uncharacterized protein DUF3408 n=1 Tax=Chryseobacterium defluvii TaxID=160396 RepID=A0A495SP33_9FLAO|nr:DUF3408 domain-containing protein [Chryseobacterium defluvii]RKT01797.1 uncharacterized protein DUF3408 [Chryseobacterium defluvii]
MGNDNKNNKAPEINEELMMSFMAKGVQKEGIEIKEEIIQTEKKEKKLPSTRHHNQAKGNYEELFFKRSDTSARDGKSVYIRQDFHEKLLRIVQVIGGNKITIYGYLDNILDYHFQEFGDQIISSFNKNNKPIL